MVSETISPPQKDLPKRHFFFGRPAAACRRWFVGLRTVLQARPQGGLVIMVVETDPHAPAVAEDDMSGIGC